MSNTKEEKFYCTLYGQGKQERQCKQQCGECETKYPKEETLKKELIGFLRFEELNYGGETFEERVNTFLDSTERMSTAITEEYVLRGKIQELEELLLLPVITYKDSTIQNRINELKEELKQLEGKS